MLNSEFNVNVVALHPGKHHPLTHPCIRVQLASMYGFSDGKMLEHGTDKVVTIIF